MASKISIEQLGEVGRQAQALGSEATGAINGALLKGARIIAGEATIRAPRARKHRTATAEALNGWRMSLRQNCFPTGK